jgi:glycosyltransferase involved in cell wall biosynthesis
VCASRCWRRHSDRAGKRVTGRPGPRGHWPAGRNRGRFCAPRVGDHPIFEGAAFIDEAIRSIQAQTLRDIEIIVVDDGSTDGSASITEKHIAVDSRVRLVRQPNAGVAAARNVGLRLARSPWVALLDQDDVALPERLERQLGFVEANPDVAALGTYGWRIGRDGHRLSVDEEGPVDRAHLAQLRASNQAIFLGASSVLFARAVALQLGGFRSSFDGAEDTDLWTRIADEHVVLAVPEPLFEYRIHSGAQSMRRFFHQRELESLIQANAVERRAGRPELDMRTFRRSLRSQPAVQRVRRTVEWRSQYCYRRAGALLIDLHPSGFVWLAASFLVAPWVPTRRLRRQLVPRLARTRARPADGTCLLMVHRVVEQAVQDHDTSWASFRELLDALQARGSRFTTDPVSEVGSTPGLVLTFDDGTADHLAVGETLAGRGIRAIFFVSAGLIGQPGYLDEADVHRLAALGHRIGSHGLVHRRLDCLDPDRIDHELVESRRRLEAMSGLPVDLYAPVGGAAVADLPRRLEQAGYVGARSTRWGIYRDMRERWAMPSLPVTELTVRRGWVEEATHSMRLPTRLALLRAAKDALPGGLRSRVRHVLTFPAARGGDSHGKCEIVR